MTFSWNRIWQIVLISYWCESWEQPRWNW